MHNLCNFANHPKSMSFEDCLFIFLSSCGVAEYSGQIYEIGQEFLCNRQIDLIQGYRYGLISDVVTDKLDVRDTADSDDSDTLNQPQ